MFISHVWRKLARLPAYARLSLDEFKQQLVEASRLGLLALSRADLVEAMNPEDVAASQINYLNAEFHFVRITPATPDPDRG